MEKLLFVSRIKVFPKKKKTVQIVTVTTVERVLCSYDALHSKMIQKMKYPPFFIYSLFVVC